MPNDRRAPRQAAQRSGEPGKSQPQWPCLLPSIAVAIAPLRNLTSDPGFAGCAGQGGVDPPRSFIHISH